MCFDILESLKELFTIKEDRNSKIRICQGNKLKAEKKTCEAIIYIFSQDNSKQGFYIRKTN